MEWASSSTRTDPCTKGSGKMISSMGLARSRGTITRSSLLVISLKGRRPEREGSNSRAAIMKAISSMVNFMDLESTISPTLAASMKVNSKTIIWKEKER